MGLATSIFLHVDLPNATTWFYFSALLAVALFFKFSRLLSIRNLDILTLFLLMPGLLLLVESGGTNRWGYVWLLAASGYYLVRCLADLTLDRRPALTPNLSLGGLVWMAAVLYVSLVYIASRQPPQPTSEDKPATPLDDVVRRPVEQFVRTQTPVPDGPDVGLWVERGLALTCHLAIVAGLVLIGWKHFEDLHTGVAAATCYLLLPYTYLLLPSSALRFSRWDHAFPMALMVWAVLGWRRPTVAGSFLGLAAGSAFFPVVLAPCWFSFYWRRGACRFLFAFLIAGASCAAILGLVVLWYGDWPRSLQSGWTLSNWQPWQAPRTETLGVWRDVPWAYRLPVFIAFLAFCAATLFWPHPKNLAHVLALSAAVLIGIQFWYTDQGGVYVLWYLPLLLLLVFRPNLTACIPAPVPDDWLARLGRSFRRLLLRLLRLLRNRRPEPAPLQKG
jgi:hypothetical protein